MSLSIDLTGRVALVTGASGGIGAGIVGTLCSAGASVVAMDLDGDALQRQYESSESVLAVPCDIVDEAETVRGIEHAVAEVGPIDALVNAAGVATRVGLPFTRLDPADWRLPWEVNVVGAFNVTKAALARSKDQVSAVVNIASVSGRTGMQTSPPYSASKAAVLNFTQVMARDLATDGVRVNAVCPGMVMTPFYSAQRQEMAAVDPEAASQTDEEFFAAKAARVIPMGRGQTPQDIGAAVAFLASDLAQAITGQALNVDGGLVMS